MAHMVILLPLNARNRLSIPGYSMWILWWTKCHGDRIFSDSFGFGLSVSLHQYCIFINTGLFISPSGISELDCATTKTDTAERSISIGRENLHVFFVLGDLAYFQVPPLGGSRDEKWRSQ